jgi:hypothetical protein
MLSLVAVLIFNTVQVRQTRLATEVGLSTNLHALLKESLVAVNRTSIPEKAAGIQRKKLNHDERAALRDALWTADYLAWLLNRKYVADDRARAYWGSLLRDSYQLGKSFPDELPIESYAELTRFVASRRRASAE